MTAHLPTLRTERLVSGFLYYDAHADDARLTLSIVRTAVLDQGAVAANYLPVVGLTHSGGRVDGALVEDLAGTGDGTEAPTRFRVRAGVVVNATGVWSDELRSLDESTHPPTIRPAKGIHLTVPQSKVPCDIAAVVPVRKDSRSIFIIPWGDQTYLGTTDTDYEGPLDDPAVEPEDVEYILAAVNAVVSEPVSAGDVTGTWAGLRPLLMQAGRKRPPDARTADLSRRHQVLTSASGLVTITGGKLTTYRKMAEDTVDEVCRVLDRRASGGAKRLGPATASGRSPTRRMKLRGAEGLAALERDAGSDARAAGIDGDAYAALLSRYGGETKAVLALAEDEPSLLEPLVEGLPHLAAEVVYAARYEMAVTVEDFLSRRSRALLRQAEGAARAARRVAELMAAELAWDHAKVEAQVDAFAAAAARTMAAAERVGGSTLVAKEAP